ncbi:hypothetical protein F5883DRAFT_589167 [Diaporthe sp. PMI_573]|nr:hypothetical protein F5883DRAFT_591361 [Diaporthaceae sp. PMI_573]KAH8744592.1 hypothetical protein F5883DRAFT_589167 [Diaporthaceae sp. PMI_573]
MGARQHVDPATKATILALRSPAVGLDTARIEAITGVSRRQITKIWNRAIERGFDPTAQPLPIYVLGNF